MLAPMTEPQVTVVAYPMAVDYLPGARPARVSHTVAPRVATRSSCVLDADCS